MAAQAGLVPKFSAPPIPSKRQRGGPFRTVDAAIGRTTWYTAVGTARLPTHPEPALEGVRVLQT
jgi:hypothetical protein